MKDFHNVCNKYREWSLKSLWDEPPNRLQCWPECGGRGTDVEKQWVNGAAIGKAAWYPGVTCPGFHGRGTLQSEAPAETGAAILRQMGWKAALEGLLADWCPRISTSRIVSSGLLQRSTEHVCYSCVCNGKQLMSIHRKVVINDASSPSDAMQPLRRQA